MSFGFVDVVNLKQLQTQQFQYNCATRICPSVPWVTVLVSAQATAFGSLKHWNSRYWKKGSCHEGVHPGNVIGRLSRFTLGMYE